MIRSPRFWDRDVDPKSREGAPLTRLMLTPLAAIYAGVTANRIRKAEPLRIRIPVICVGNISAGGTGKSPVAAALRSRLSDLYPGIRIATLSRGYGGKLKGPLKVNVERHVAADVGDEAIMLSRGGEAWIGPDRALAGQAMQDDGVDLIIMDDGHQNPGLAKDLSFVVVDSVAGFGNGYVIPKGPLRDPVEAGLARADAVIVMGPSAPPSELGSFANPVLFAQIEPTGTLPDRSYVAFAGIGRPEKFFDTLSQSGVSLADAVPFPDHHPYDKSDLRYLRDLAKQRDAVLVTTEKDYVRLGTDDRRDIMTFPVQARFKDTDTLDKLLASVSKRLPK